MPGHSMGTLYFQVPSYPAPAQLPVWKMLKQLGDAPTENYWIFEFDSEATLGHTIALNLEHFDHAFATNLRTRAA